MAVRLPVVSPQLHLRPVLNARMSAIPTDEPAQDDTQQIQQQLQQQDTQLNPQSASTEPNRKRSSILFFAVSVPDFCSAKAPSVRRACVACHTGKTRCSEVLPCQVGSVLLLFTAIRFNTDSELSQKGPRNFLCLS